MHPLAMLLGIVMGSAVSITVALILTLVVFLFLPEFADRIAEEFPPLLQTLWVTAALALVATAAFVAELKGHRSRRPLQVILALFLSLIVYSIWPEPRA